MSVSKKHTKLIIIVLLLVAILAVCEIYFGILRKNYPVLTGMEKIDGTYLVPAQKITDFSLTATNEKTFSNKNLNGQWTMMFFGFANCGTVCPTTMAALNDMYKLLQTQLPDKSLPQVVMVSVDPDRDTLQRMKEYVRSFNPHFIGARADITKTVLLEKQLHIAAAKIETDGQGGNHYTINHSAEILVFNPDGQLQAYLAYPHDAKQLAKDYQNILRAASHA